jgi:hypothetical protein
MIFRAGNHHPEIGGGLVYGGMMGVATQDEEFLVRKLSRQSLELPAERDVDEMRGKVRLGGPVLVQGRLHKRRDMRADNQRVRIPERLTGHPVYVGCGFVAQLIEASKQRFPVQVAEIDDEV